MILLSRVTSGILQNLLLIINESSISCTSFYQHGFQWELLHDNISYFHMIFTISFYKEILNGHMLWLD